MRRAALRKRLAELSRPDGPRRSRLGGPLRLEDIDRICGLAEWHGVLPAVLRNLSSAESKFAAEPPALVGLLDGWRGRSAQQAGLSLLLRALCAGIIKALSRSNVPHMVLKGPEFADRLYSDPALRPFTDLDLLVPRRSVAAAAAVMTDLGYVGQRAQGLKHEGGYGEQTFARPDQPGAKIEIHWNVVNSPALQKGVSVVFEDLQFDGGEEMPVRPSAASLLLIAAVHGATGHAFQRLQTLCDVRQAAAGAAGETDDDWLAGASARTGAARPLAVGLDLAAGVFGDSACERLARRFKRGLRTHAARMLLTRAMVAAPPPLSRLRRQAFRQLLKRR